METLLVIIVLGILFFWRPILKALREAEPDVKDVWVPKGVKAERDSWSVFKSGDELTPPAGDSTVLQCLVYHHELGPRTEELIQVSSSLVWLDSQRAHQRALQFLPVAVACRMLGNLQGQQGHPIAVAMLREVVAWLERADGRSAASFWQEAGPGRTLEHIARVDANRAQGRFVINVSQLSSTVMEEFGVQQSSYGCYLHLQGDGLAIVDAVVSAVVVHAVLPYLKAPQRRWLVFALRTVLEFAGERREFHGGADNFACIAAGDTADELMAGLDLPAEPAEGSDEVLASFGAELRAKPDVELVMLCRELAEQHLGPRALIDGGPGVRSTDGSPLAVLVHPLWGTDHPAVRDAAAALERHAVEQLPICNTFDALRRPGWVLARLASLRQGPPE